MEDQELREIAKERVDRKQGFRSHLIVYLIVNSGFWFINLYFFLTTTNDSSLPWAMFPTIGWGIG